MPHPFLASNPFNLVVQLHQQGVEIDKDFRFWLRSFRAPPIRTFAQLIEHCPRVDWAFWCLEHAARLQLIESDLVVRAGWAVNSYLQQVRLGRTYTNERVSMPNQRGMDALRVFISNEFGAGT